MDLMDMAKSAAEKILGTSTGTANMMGAVSQLITENGGIGQIVEKFNSAGLGNVVQSWISTGQNLPINAEQITQIFGGTQFEQIAKNLNINGSDLGSSLSTMLPQLIDKITPDGQLNADSMDMNKLVVLGKGLFAKN